jgi:hypothetical protein
MLTFTQEVVTVNDKVDEVLQGYLTAALYFSRNDSGISYSVFYDHEDFVEEDVAEIFIEISTFLAKYRNIVKTSFKVPLSYIGEDLWLSQHNMGGGFTDADYNEHCTILDTLAKSFLPKTIYEKDGMLRIVTKKK